MKPDLETLFQFGSASFTGIVLIALAGAIWLHFNKDNVVSLSDLVAESSTGKLSLSKVGQLAALVVSTWGFVHLTLAYKLTEWYFTAYMLAWAGTNLMSKWLKTRASNNETQN